MALSLQLIREINPKTRSWTVKVKVVEKTNPRTSATGRRFQRLLLEDSEHTCVQATIFGADIDIFQNTLTISRKYCISNAVVRYIAPIHRIVPNDNQWTINGSTFVEEIVDTTDNEKTTNHKFTPFSDLRLDPDMNSTVDIIAIALKISPQQQKSTKNGETTIQEILLITEESKPLTLTLWDQFVRNEGQEISKIIDSWPVILAKRLKIVGFNGLSLSTKSTSFLMANPEIPEATSLRSWSVENRDNLNNIIDGRPQPAQIKRARPTKNNILDINVATQLKPMNTFWIKASASITDFEQSFWYVGCSKCYKTIYIESGRIYNCMVCNQPQVTAEPRCRFNVELCDATGKINAKCLGHIAEKLFPITAAQLKEQTNKEGIIDKSFLTTIPLAPAQLLLLKPYESDVAGKAQRSLTIVQIQDEHAETSKPKME